MDRLHDAAPPRHALQPSAADAYAFETGRPAVSEGTALVAVVFQRDGEVRRVGDHHVGLWHRLHHAPLRSLALMALDHPSWLQAWLVGGAMGYRGDVPALCRDGAARRRA